MVKIVIFVAIVALACVNAQYPGFPTGGASGLFNMFKNMGMMPPTMLSPEDLINTPPKPGQHFQAQYANAESSGGKLRTTMIRNIDGEMTGFTVTN